MLEEVSNVPQPPRTPGRRRWFCDSELDLIVWYAESGEIHGFQLCYDLGKNERALTWKRGGRMRHSVIDPGDEQPQRNDSPILVETPIPPAKTVVENFLARAAGLDPAIIDTVVEALFATDWFSPD